MSYYECPFCERDVTSIIAFCTPAIYFDTKKKCPHCSEDIRVKPFSVVSIYLFIIFFGIIFPICIENIFESLKGKVFIVAWIVLVFIQFFIPNILHRLFGIKLFLPRLRP